MPNARVLRDIKARHGVNANEILRRAYLYVARNQTLPPQVRFQAQLQLNTFGRYTRPTTVKNRCTETGRGRGVISEFGLCRVRMLVRDLCYADSRCTWPPLVPVPVKSIGERAAWCQKGILVERRGRFPDLHLYIVSSLDAVLTLLLTYWQTCCFLFLIHQARIHRLS